MAGYDAFMKLETVDGEPKAEKDLAVDPTNPNTEVDGRDFLIWQRGNATPGPDDNVGLPAVQTDDGLLLPAVRMDDGEASITDGTSNTVLIFERYGQTGSIGGISVASGDVNGDTDALGDPVTFTYTVTVDPSAYEGSHVLYQDVFVPPLETGGMGDGSVRFLTDSVSLYNPYTTVDYIDA